MYVELIELCCQRRESKAALGANGHFPTEGYLRRDKFRVGYVRRNVAGQTPSGSLFTSTRRVLQPLREYICVHVYSGIRHPPVLDLEARSTLLFN